MQQTKIKTLFFGSGIFAVPILEELLNYEFIEILAVVTQPDKPVGRKQMLTPVPVKELLEKFYPKIPIYTPVKYKEVEKSIINMEKPELILVADYGQMIPEFTINYPKYKCLNIHGSLLPDLRGAVPIPMAILYGYKETGVSIPIMTTGLDSGPVLASKTCEITSIDTSLSLKQKLALEGATLLIETLPKWIEGEITPIEQDEKKATYADKSLLNKDKAQFFFYDSLEKVDRMIRAFNPWPVAWCYIDFNGERKRLKIFDAKIHNDKQVGEGNFLKEKDKLYLGLSDGSLELLELQMEGKKVGKGSEYLFLEKDIHMI